ncbi:MAG: response regulator transcription factor [Roseburia sp.]|nr:response regulator transcription factor [Ruminococcus sp.]MCM1155231.1 response regulator transcription factor [Roseburia sp.]MCM1241201.1 response regulator transcription factor [Roseburia sp.]
MKILIIEDDSGLSRGISFALEQEGYETLTACTIQEGYALFEKENPGAIILDLNLPDGDGLDLCRKIRGVSAHGSQIPLLMLTARDMEMDEIMGLTNGADDYMTKPFSISILKVRLQNILHRKSPAGSDNTLLHSGDTRLRFDDTLLRSGDISLDTRLFRAFENGQELNLSVTEFRLLHYFLENKGRALLKEQILQHIWDADGNFVEENTLSVNISRLRRKLSKEHIRTIQGIGYLWEDNA